MAPCWLWVGGRMIYHENTYISTLDRWACIHYSLRAGGGGTPSHLRQPVDAQFIMHTLCYRTWSFILSFHVTVFGRGLRGLRFRWLYYSSLLLYSCVTFLFCSGTVSSNYICKSWRQSHSKESGSSILALRTHPPLPHLSPFISLSASRGTWKSYCLNALCLAQWNNLPALSSPGQNESGVAVHDDRIYVVGGYSIWTNEPLACIQVRDAAFTFGLITVVTRQNTIRWSDRNSAFLPIISCTFSEVKQQHMNYETTIGINETIHCV